MDSPDAPVRPFWFIPSHGDGRWLGSAEESRSTEFGYLSQIGQAADRLGFEGVLLPTGRTCEDSWILASALAPLTRRLKFLVAVRPGVTSPLFAARQAATLDRVSGGRVLINVVAGGSASESAADGVFDDHDARYAVTDEFLTIWRRLMAGGRVDFKGEHLRVEGAELLFRPVQAGGPPLYLANTSTTTSPGASRRRMWPRRSPRCARAPPRPVARCGSASASTSSSARPRARPGPRRSG